MKVKGTISRAERAKKNFFDPPPTFGLPEGDMKQDIAVFFTAIMTSDLDQRSKKMVSLTM